MIRIREISLPPEHNPAQLPFEAAQALRISQSKIRRLSIVRRSVDARKKPDVRIVYTVDVAVDGNENKILKNSHCKRASIAADNYYKVPKCDHIPENRPVVVGFGPAGMFAALVLALAGLKPIVLERGEDAVTRHQKVQKFWKSGELDPMSNVQFGEGGAGTFSDGKLNTGVNNPRIGWILEQFVKAGARENILFDAKPHIGTDVLLEVVQNLRMRIISLGGEVRFGAQVTGILQKEGQIFALEINGAETIACHRAIFAIGHSARDTFSYLYEQGIPMEAKPFAMGVRIEHPQTLIDTAQYGAVNPVLPPADYKLVKHLDNETVYTFCMCPGGYVVAAASEEGGVVTNGMSYADREGENANAALLVTVNPKDFSTDHPLAGMYWQREIEEKAFAAGGCNYKAPAQLVGDFLNGKPSTGAGSVQPTYKPGVKWCDLHDVLPEKITAALKTALPQLDGNLKGFAHPDSVLTAPETRSSSPVRINRDENCQSTGLRGLYPAGEGAGYAGGIMSAAIDGMLCAEALMEGLK
ncbi:MAG: hypothetical protein IJZ14_00710 [Oscillospiraceae bacterium]|nr:hypothetical protein [Oscillospiraceae bacterium]MBQ8881730.1 hypothetical protein [Oscillospiraceae bacterium]